MKKIEAVIHVDREKDVIDALRQLKLGGMTLYHGKGRGKGPRKIKEGPGRQVERYADNVTIFTVVDDSMADQVVTVIADAAHTGALGDGKIFLSTIDEVMDIFTMKKGKEYL